MRDVIESGKNSALKALSQIQKQEIKQYILNDARYFKETFDFLMDSHATESLKKYVGNIGSVLKELSLSKNSDHAYKAKRAIMCQWTWGNKFPKEAILILSALK
jgi:hypothetical protein